jgi:hypothetical protein
VSSTDRRCVVWCGVVWCDEGVIGGEANAAFERPLQSRTTQPLLTAGQRFEAVAVEEGAGHGFGGGFGGGVGFVLVPIGRLALTFRFSSICLTSCSMFGCVRWGVVSLRGSDLQRPWLLWLRSRPSRRWRRQPWAWLRFWRSAVLEVRSIHLSSLSGSLLFVALNSHQNSFLYDVMFEGCPHGHCSPVSVPRSSSDRNI